MEFTQFAEKFTERMRAQFATLEVHMADVEKLQGQSYHGLVLKEPEGPVGISLNLDNYYRDYITGKSMEELLASACTEILGMNLTSSPVDLEMIKDYETMKQYLILQLVPIEGNEEMLEKVPHRLFADLAVVYRFLLPRAESGEASILVTKENMKAYGIGEERLAADASVYAEERHPLSVRSICDVLFGGTREEEQGGMLWVVSNDSGRYGASAVTYPGALERIGERLGSDYYLVPSSVHEMLAIPDGAGIDAKGLDNMVCSVNSTEVAPEDRLSNHSYHYNRKQKLFEDAAEYEARLAYLSAPIASRI